MAETKDSNEKRASKSRFTFRDYVQLILSNWYWFVIALLVCGFAAKYYLHYTPPKYQRTASILIKDSRKGTGAELAAFSDIAGVMGRHSVDNEIYILQSRTLMDRVVRKYDLATTYTSKGRIRTTDLYGRAPMKVHFLTLSPSKSGSFTYTMNGDGSANIKNFSTGSFSATVMPGDTIATPLGDIVMTPTKAFEKYKHLEVNVSRNTLNNAIEKYRGKLKCEIADKMSSVINLTIVDEVPRRAEDVINGVIDAYHEDAIREKQKISDITEQFINERLATLSEELNIADSDVANFKQDNQLYSPENEATMISNEIARLNEQAISLNFELSVAEYVLETATANSESISLMPAFDITSRGSSNTSLASDIQTYNKGVLEFQRLKAYSDNNPVITDMESQLKDLRKTIIVSLNTYIEGLKVQISGITKELDTVYTTMKSSPNREKDLMAIMRDQSVKQQLYIYLKEKGEENKITRATVESNARTIDRAHGSDIPVSPKPWLIYLIAIIIGLVVPFAILYIRELLNTKVRSHKEVEEALSIPLIGIVPRHDSKVSHGSVVVREDGRDMTSEAFRILRTNLSFMSVDNPIKVIMLTSSVPHSGKTYVASNLATTLAIAGSRVLMIDLDLRRRTFTKMMGRRNDRRGVTSYLTGGIESLNDAITHSDTTPNLDIMFAGPQPPNPTELLMSKRMCALIEELRGSYDYIIIDSVPALAVADAMVIDRYVDHTIYVVRQGNLDRRQLPDIEALHRDKKIHSMSILYNGATFTKNSYGYGYGYGYGYNYDDDDTPMWKRRWRSVKRLFKKR